MSSRVWTLALFCLGGLLATGSTFADGDAPTKRPRAVRHAALLRAVDADGDRHERILRDVAARRTADRVGDAEVARLFRDGHEGLAVVHANLERSKDPKGDVKVLEIARLRNARRGADLRRTRDLRGDEPVLTAYKNFRIRHGNLTTETYRIAEDGRNERRALYREERDPRSGADRLTTEEDRVRRDERSAERRDERELWREVRGTRRVDDTDLEDDDELEREEERLLEKAEEEAEQEAEREEEAEDRDLDREEDADEAKEDREADRQINNEEGDLEEEDLDE